MSQLVNESRRKFLKHTGIAGGGLIVGFSLSGCGSTNPPITPVAGAYVANAFVQITPDNLVRFYCPRDEMGQGVTTGLTTLIAEELDVAPQRIDVALAGPHEDYANPDFGVQGTGGSTSIKAHYQQLRQVGANVRAVILAAAAQDLEVAVTQLTTDDAYVVLGNDRYPFGQFVSTAQTLAIPEDTPLKTRHEFKYIGTEFPRLDAQAKATGTAEYGIDIDIPGMHHAVVKRSPVAGGTVKSVDKIKTLALPGVTDVIEISSGVAVVAQKFWQAKQAAQTLPVEWNLPEFAQVSTPQIQADYKAALSSEDGLVDAEQGNLSSGFDEAEHVIENEYWAPYLAHAPMEPMNAVVRIENGEADVWSGTQGIAAAQGLVARYAGLERDKVRAHATYLGGAFGRRGTLTHIIEATQIAVESNKPIHLLWTREDDIQNGIYRPASLVQIKAGMTSDGDISAWQATRVGGNITPDTLSNMLPGFLPSMVSDGMMEMMVGLSNRAFDGWVVDPSSIEGLCEDYDLPNREVRHITRNHGLPLTFWRSVGHSFTAFAKETLVDELAVKGGLDGIEMRLRNTKNKPRLNNVIRLAGERMAAMQPPTGHYLGFAAHSSFGTDVAEVAEISISHGQIKVHNVLCVLDCGQVVNPDVVRTQIEGSIMYGLTAALYGNLEIDNGRVRESNFHDYPILRMNEAPSVEVVMVDSSEAPTGVGEPGLPPIAPAVANAVFAATGHRLRSLPLKIA